MESRASRKSGSTRPRVCRSCGQHHSHHEPHIYDYPEEVDEDLMCQICLQPFVSPTDTPCSHTFCQACISSYLRVNASCPICRKPLNEMTCTPSNLVLKRLLDKLSVICPNSDSCKENSQRGILEDHLKYRCDGTLVACQFAGAGCIFRGPVKKMKDHQLECTFKKEGITRLPILEGEVSHVEIPRTSSSLGITIVGGSDTPLRCVVVQEVFPDGLVASDGRLQPGDQIIEINGIDMTCASHAQVCAALRKMTSVLRLGVYRERIEKYGGRVNVNNTEELLTVTLERQPGKHLGIRISGSCPEPGIFIVEILEDSITANDGRIKPYDRLLFINGTDVRHCKISQASDLIKNNEKVVLVVARKKVSSQSTAICGSDEADGPIPGPQSHPGVKVSHTRSKSAPSSRPKEADSDTDTTSEINGRNGNDDETEGDETDGIDDLGSQETIQNGNNNHHGSSDDMINEHFYDLPEGEDYMAIYETIDRKRQEAKDMKVKSASMEELETPTASVKSFNMNSDSVTAKCKAEPQIPREKKRHRSKSGSKSEHRKSIPEASGASATSYDAVGDGMAQFLKKALRIEGPQLTQKTVTIRKNVRESLGMRIGGGIGSNEGDTPIYIANIHPHGCIGKSKQMKKGDLLLKVNDSSLDGLTHSQAVATLKATINLSSVVLVIMEGPETSFGASNFIPSWMYWQKLPRVLQYPKTVILHRRDGTSWGFSIVGGAEPGSDRSPEPVHVLFVVPESPAAKDGKLKCGDRLLAVDGHSLECVPHSAAVTMLKQTSTRVVMEVVSWMGTEL
eukprot:GFUD01009761.1.p1 GENE.GFUD01009761.1~~GFUD01009761.1.p1  ORF type:complete len:793 (-),score=143.29 GFUD01009761.1:1113-3491(-)